MARQSSASSEAGCLGCIVTLVALMVFCIVVGAGLAIGWGLIR